METSRGPWAVVLAAGEGSRLRSLTTDSTGKSVPKQFWSLDGGPSLLQMALRRAGRVVSRSRIVTIVAAEHGAWWHEELGLFADPNVVVQPKNRGTAVGVLLPVLSILARDPAARIVLLPSDHYVADEALLEAAVREGLGEVDRKTGRLVLLGVVPDEPDPGFGWIVPARGGPGAARPVRTFVEKPDVAVATELMGRGAVWNSFIMVSSGRTLVELFETRLPGVTTDLREALRGGPGDESSVRRLAGVYDGLTSFDFCRDVLEGLEHRLSVLPVPSCGWSDLGTPERVARCVARQGVARRPLIPGEDGFDHGPASRPDTLRSRVTDHWAT